MTVSQPSTLLLEESGSFEGATPVRFDIGKSGEYSRKRCGSGEAEGRFGRETKESTIWIDGKITLSF
jgi:hypothetical protein